MCHMLNCPTYLLQIHMWYELNPYSVSKAGSKLIHHYSYVALTQHKDFLFNLKIEL